MSAQSAKTLHWLPAFHRWPKLRHRLGLRARIAILVSSGLLLLIAIFVVLGLSALRVSTEREIQQKAVIAQIVAANLDAQIVQAAGFGEWIAGDAYPLLASSDRSNLTSQLSALFQRAYPVSAGLRLFNSDGQLIGTSSLLGGERAITRESADAIAAGKPWAAEWVRDAGGRAEIVMPVRGSGLPVIGYVGLLVDLSPSVLAHQLGATSIGTTALLDLVDSRGTVLSSTSEEARLGPSDHEAIFGKLTAEGKTSVGQCYDCHSNADGTTRQSEIMAFAPLHSAAWGVVFRQSDDEVLEPNRMLQEQVLALGAAALLFALFMVWLTTRSVLGPIASMTVAARRIADGSLDDPVASEGSDEIAELGQTLEGMRTRLKHSLDEVKGYNVELNRRVIERTAELEKSRDELETSRDSMKTLVDRLSILNAIATELSRSLDPDEVLSGALAHALKLASMESGAIYLVNEQTGELDLAAHIGISRDAAAIAANLGLSASLCASAANAGEPLVVENTERYARGSRSLLVVENMRFMVRVPFKASGGLLGTICLGSPHQRPFSRTEMDLLMSVGNQIALAVEKTRLYQELQRKDKLRGDLLQKVISAQEEERKRIARELHDETSQALAALAVAVETAASQCANGGDVGASVARMRTLTQRTLEEVHRLIFDLRPTLLDDLGLIAALRWYAETRLGEAGIRVRLEIAGEERRLAPLIETTLYRVVQEAVNNVANHSGAQNFVATLVLEESRLTLTMTDDGWGFDIAEVQRSADSKRGLGLMGMKERVELLGGTLTIYSELGQGTRLSLEVPLEREADEDE